MRLFFALVICLFSSLVTVVTANELNGVADKGVIEFAVYEKYPPFSYRSDQGKPVGIDIEIGKSIARELGVKAKFRLVPADESVDDDLRNYIWKGHFTAGGKSDVMLHVPYDERFIKQVDQVKFLTPYYNEEVIFALDPNRTGNAVTLEIFAKEKIGVEIETLADVYLLSAFGGLLRDNTVHFPSVNEASEALINGEIAAIMATRTEIEAGLGEAKGKFKIGSMPTPGLTEKSWDLGIAVKEDRKDLATSLKLVMNKLLRSGEIKKIFSDHGVTHKEAGRTSSVESTASLLKK